MKTVFIAENRFAQKLSIQVSFPSNIIKNEDFNRFFHPFFVVSNTLSNENDLFASVSTVYDQPIVYEYSNGVFHVSCDEGHGNVLYNIMCLVRMIFKDFASQQGFHNIHAGCFSCNGKGIAIVAGRNEGKTTLLLNSMKEGIGTLCANDQFMFSPNDGLAFGYPSAIGIRNGSIDDSDINSKLTNLALFHCDDPYQSNSKPAVLINDLATVLDCRVVSSLRLQYLLLYHKSFQNDMLNISTSLRTSSFLLKHRLPLQQTYDMSVLSKWREEYSSGQMITGDLETTKLYVMDVICGRNRVSDLLHYIHSITL